MADFGRTINRVMEARRRYKQMLAQGAHGDRTEAYNISESARQGQPVAGLEDADPEMRAMVNRIADTADYSKGGPLNAPLLGAYEALKGVEQNTPIKPISMLADAGVPRVTKSNKVTTPASWENAISSLLGPLLGS